MRSDVRDRLPFFRAAARHALPPLAFLAALGLAPLPSSVSGSAGRLEARDFIRGDSNQDDELTIADPQYTLNFLFLGGPPSLCPAAVDANDDEEMTITDPIVTLNFLFLGTDRLAPPGTVAGPDPTPGLGCGGIDGPAGLACLKRGPAVLLSWTNRDAYDSVQVLRGAAVIRTLPGSAEDYRDVPPEGGDHTYRVRGLRDGDRSDEATCAVTGLPDNRPPFLVLVSPAQGVTVSGDSVRLRVHVNDDSGVARVLVAGIDASPAAPPIAPYDLEVDVPLSPGPNLIRCEAVDEGGLTVFDELAVGRSPLLPSGGASQGFVLDITGATGYDELQAIVRPFLDDVPALLDGAVRGVLLFEGSVLGVDIRVTGERAEVTGPVSFDFFPAAERVGMNVGFPRIRLFADGRSDYGFLGTDNWDATWTANNVTITGTFALSPLPGGSGLAVATDGFTVAFGSSDLSVSGFLDPFGIFDGLVNFLADLFQDEIEAQVRAAVEDAIEEELLPTLAETLSNLRLDLDLDTVSMATTFHDVLESLAGLSLEFDAVWTSTARDPGFPLYPGSAAGFAPYPSFPLGIPTGHPLDATISLSADTLNQALAELVATGALATTLDLSELEAPIPLGVSFLATFLDRRLDDGIAPDAPVLLRVEARFPVRAVLGAGTPGRPLIAEGESWRYGKGLSEPPAAWAQLGFADSGWPLGRSGFGYSTNPDELLTVQTQLADMSGGSYTALYLRKTFTVDDPAAVGGLVLRVLHDDAFVAYLNGEEVARRNVTGAPPLYTTLADAAGEPVLATVDLGDRRSLLRAGGNVLALQGHNAAPSSSDFVLTPTLIETALQPPGTLGAIPIELDVRELVVSFVADTARDGIAPDDASPSDDVELFAYTIGFRLAAALLLVDEGGVPTVAFNVDTGDGPDPDSFPDALIGGADGLRLGLAGERVDMDDEVLIEFADSLLSVFGSTLTGTLEGLDLPALPLPELEFDIDGDGVPDVRLDILAATVSGVDTTGDGEPDWVCILSDLGAGSP
jgi:hypothetical protein